MFTTVRSKTMNTLRAISAATVLALSAPLPALAQTPAQNADQAVQTSGLAVRPAGLAVPSSELPVQKAAVAAQKIDLTAMKCRQLPTVGNERLATITTWLVGFYTEAREGEIIDLDRVKDISAKLVSFCVEHPNFGVTGAAEGLLSK